MARKQQQFPRPFGLEYYRQLVHHNPFKITAVQSEINALVAASKHLDRGDYVKVVCIERGSERVLWTRMKIGRHLILQRGRQHGDEVTVEIVGL